MAKSLEKILDAYSKEIIIEWIVNVFRNNNLEKELKDAKNDLEFIKADKELDTLLKKQNELSKKSFDTTVAIEMRKNLKRISYLLDKQEKLLYSE